MEDNIDLNAAYVPSEDVVAREIEGEIIIVPLTAGIGDMEEDLYSSSSRARLVLPAPFGPISVTISPA